MGLPAVGANANLTCGFEKTYGVNAETDGGVTLAFVNESLKGTQALIDNPSLSGDPNPRQSVGGKIDAGGNIQVVPSDVSAPWWLKFGLGDLTSTDKTTYWEHVAEIKSGSLPSITVEKEIPFAAASKYLIGQGFVCDTFKISAKQDGFVTFDLGTVGAKFTKTLAASSNFTTPVDLTTGEFFENMMIAAADCELGGTDIATLQEFSLSISHNVYKDHYVVGGAGNRVSAPRGRAKVELDVKGILEDESLYGLLATGAAVAFRVKWGIATHQFLQIDIPALTPIYTSPAIESDGPLMLDAKFSAFLDTGTSAVTITVENDTAGTSYATAT